MCGESSTTYGSGIDAATTATDRRAELARAAYELIAESGVGALSLRALARRLGATTGLVSHHFLDRAELITAALDHAASVMVARLVDRGQHDAHPVEVITAVLPTDPESIENWRFSLSVRAAGLFDAELLRFDRRLAAYWAGYLPDRLGPLVADDSHEAADHLLAVLDGVALRAISDPDAWPATRQVGHIERAFAALTTSSDRPPPERP